MRRLLWLALLPVSTIGHTIVHYGIDFMPSSRQVHVTIQLDAPKRCEEFRIPAWSPGYYQIAHYEDTISDVEAKTADGESLIVKADGKRGWQVENPNQKSFQFAYMVAGTDAGLGFFGTSVLGNDGFVNGASAFMNVDGRIEEPTSLKISVPQGWDIATPLDAGADGTYAAAGYDEMIDSPIQVGQFTRKTFTAQNLPYEVIYVAPDGNAKADLDAETARFAKLVVPAIKIFHGTPFKHYTFFIHLAPGNFNGGLEHRACTVINVQNSAPLDMDDLITHEYFHAWNIKNIRPLVLGPFDYTKAVRTDNLWFGEGVTDYYAKLTAYQSGLEGQQWLFDQLGEEISIVQHSRDRAKYTLALASRGAWEGESQGLGDLSYYDKGLLVGLLLDAEIRSETNGAKSLDDLMRLLYARHRLPLPGYAENEIRATSSEVAGKDLGRLYDALVYSTNELPYEVLSKIGLRVEMLNRPFLDPGFHIGPDGRITQVTDAVRALGLKMGDTPVLQSLEKDKAKFTVDRDQKPFEVTVPLKQALGEDFRVESDPLAAKDQVKLRTEWLQR